MEDTPTAIIIDASTGEATEQPLTEEQVAEREVMLAETEQKEAERLAQEAAKESARAKLAVLGLTEEEVLALIG